LQQEPEALNLEQVVGVLRRRLPVIVLCVVVVAGTAFAIAKRETKKYTATASLGFSDNTLSQQIAGLPPTNASDLAAQQSSNLNLVQLGDMAAKTAGLLGHGLTAETVSGSLNIGGKGESSVVNVSATTSSPALAADIANTYAREFVKEQQSANREYFRSALALVHKQLAALSPRQRIGSDGLQLQDRAQTLTLLAELNYNSVDVAQEALAPSSPSSPRVSRDAALGVFVGLVLGLGLAFLLEHFDRRIRRPEDLEAIYHLPMLGVVPKSPVLSRSARRDGGRKRTALPPVEAEAFGLIRAHLRFFNVDRDLRTVVIASAAPGDGKSTIARHLAEAAARLGSRVLLLEADLRYPTLAHQLDLQSSGRALTDVLIGAITLDEAIQSVKLDALPDDGGAAPTLDVLPAGATLPPNPGALLESHAMDAVLEYAKFAYDCVLIDTPPLTAVSDAFPLLTKVDGVVIVGWVGRSRRDAAERLHQILASSGAPLLGVIANGTKSGGPASDAYVRDAKSPRAASATVASSSEQVLI
jgi:succinoglycan biosynthesis transport protein ExoP